MKRTSIPRFNILMTQYMQLPGSVSMPSGKGSAASLTAVISCAYNESEM